MKTTLILCLFLSSIAHAQWGMMRKYSEVGKGNYYLFTRSEKNAKRIILETLNNNNLSYDVVFYKGGNLFLNTCIVDPLNSEFVYVIHSIRGHQGEVPGYHILCYYMENRYRYFYDVTQGENRISLVYDPAILHSKTKKK